MDTDDLDATGVSWTTFAQTMAQLPGRVLPMLDTCHVRGAVEMPTDAVFAACAKGELTQESADWGHGAFTRALLDGLGGAAHDDRSGVMTLTELARYVGGRGPTLTKNAQNPILTMPTGLPADLPLAAVGPAHASPAPSPAL